MWKSNAKWTKIDDSHDTHFSEKGARAVCNLLEEMYGKEPGCPVRGVCTYTWVEEEKKDAE